MYTVYILRSLKNGRYYVGQTSNLERRLEEHNLGRSRYTSLTKPFELVYTEICLTRREAVRRERQIKSYKGGSAFKNLLVGYAG